MSRDMIGDFLAIIRNGIMASKPSVVAPHSKMRYEIAQILKQEGFIKNVIVDEQDPIKKNLKIDLKYVDGESVIHEIKRYSKPGRRWYFGARKIKPVIGGLGISILTTNKGVLSHKQAEKFSVGGEVICTVW